MLIMQPFFVNVKHFFHGCGKENFQVCGKENFPEHGKENFHRCGNEQQIIAFREKELPESAGTGSEMG
jgi:hypothetical protein